MTPATDIGLPRYIAVEGPIGVGKTTLSHMLASHTKARVVLEEFDDNPFLRDFYQDPARVAFQTQIYFLTARYKQQEELRQQDLFAQGVVSDYLFAKDRIFAYMNLSEHELALYERIYELLRPHLVKPDLVIYLQARTDVLLARMRKRGREYEAPIQATYLDNLMRGYNQFFFHYDESPLLVIETSDIDFKHNPAHFQAILDAIARTKSGTHHFVPEGVR